MFKHTYEIGDTVLIRDDLSCDAIYANLDGSGEIGVYLAMTKRAGTLAKIDRYRDTIYYGLEGDDQYYWTDEMFAGKVDEVHPIEQSKTSIRVFLRGGDHRAV